MARELQRERLFTRRAAMLAGVEALLFATLGGRLYQLQITERRRYTLLSAENSVSLRLIPPPRGRILDRFGAPLADNRHDYRVVIIAEEAGNVPATLDALAALIPIAAAERARVLREVRQKRAFVPVVVRDALAWDEVARIEVAVSELPGVAIERGLVRHYPQGAAAAHAVGYVAAATEKQAAADPLLQLPGLRVGKSGIEKAEDLRLRGIAGTSQVEVNALGRVVRELDRSPAQPGEDVVATIDAGLQQFAAARLASERSAAAVVIDAPTGEVLAFACQPSFDPAVFSKGFSPSAWHALADDPAHPLVAKIIAGTYPPGSTFKPAVAAAALSAGVLTPETIIFCPGYLRLGDAVFHCWRHGGHGSLTVRNAIKESCDVFFYETALRLGIDRLASGVRRFGYGSRLGIDIPGEMPGLIPTRAWQRAATGKPWTKGETVIAGIGQGAVAATPLQIATMVARLVTGRAIVPRLLRRAGVMTAASDAAGRGFPRLELDPDALALVREGMGAVVNEPGGTGYKLRITQPGFQMGGKSGTSQVRRMSRGGRPLGGKELGIPWRDRDDSLFIAFAPVAAPRYVCATIVEHGGFGADAAGPICRDLMLEVQRRDPARRVPAASKIAQSGAAERARSGGG